MDRNASGTWITELALPSNAPCFLFEMYFDSGTDYLTDCARPIVYGGHTYLSTGRMLSFSGLTESQDMQIPTVNLTFSGVDQTYISLAMNEPFMDRRMVIRKCLLDAAQSAISSPVIIFDGRMDTMTIADAPGQDSTVQVTATSQWADFERKPGRHTNSQEQGVYFPGDKFFDYTTQLNRQLKWGVK